MTAEGQSPGWTIKSFGEVDSTMEVAAEFARNGSPTGTVVVADHQTQGRGQRGRVWVERPGTCLLFTVVLRPALDVATDPGLSRRIAEQVARAIVDITGLSPTIKDPNDVLIAGRKVCGILSQTSIRGDRLEYLLIGIGLNVNIPASDLPFEAATSLLAETGLVFDRGVILEGILDQVQAIAGLCRGVPTRSLP